jgi:hypothetical protein
MERKTSWRPNNFAAKHDVSPSFIYNEIRDKRLRAHKAADGVTIITEEDEADWLSAMRTIGAPKPDAAESIEPTESEGGAKARAGPS